MDAHMNKLTPPLRALILFTLVFTLFFTAALVVSGPGEEITLENPDDPSQYTQMTAADFRSCTNCKFETFLQNNPSQAETYLSSNYNAEDAAVYFRQQRPITGNNKEIMNNPAASCGVSL